MTKRKPLFILARAAMTLLLAVAGIANASAAAHWVGNSAIFVNGTWYYAGSNLDWCTGGAFNDANLGTFINSIPLAGQSQNHENGDVNWNGGSVTMFYKIDGGEQQSISLPWKSYNSDTHNNLFESKDDSGDLVITNVDISGLSAGSHTIEVYYYCDDAWDSNNSQNYKANFTVCAPTKTVNYIDENGDTQSVTANVLANGSNTSDIDAGWYVSEGNVNFINTLSFTGHANLILADGADVTIDQYGETGIYANGNLNLYAQSLGNSKGSIRISKPSYGIWANNVNINGGNIGISDCIGGIYASTGDVYLNSGDVTIDCENTGISAKLGSGIIILAGTNITGKSYSGTVKVKSGLVYSDGTNNNIKGTISDVSDIANKTLSLYGYSYLDENGDELTKTTNEVIVINSGNKPNTLGTANTTTWYVITGTVKYTNDVNIKGTVNLILADECAMNMGTDTDPISGYYNVAIWADNNIPGDLIIYGQEEGTGNLTIYADGYGIHTFNNGYITINGGTVNTIVKGYGKSGIHTGNFTINGGTLITSSEEACGIEVDQNITINGGSITATGYHGIIANGIFTILSGVVTANGKDYGYGISAGDITITGGKVMVSNTSDYDEVSGIWSSNNIYIYDGEVYVNVKDNSEPIENAGSNGIGASHNINIYDGTVISAGTDSGLYTDYEDIIINGGNVKAIACGTYASIAIRSYSGNVIINGGNINANGVKYGIHSSYDTTINGGNVTATGGEDGISASNTILAGGTIKANSYYGTVIVANDIKYSDGVNEEPYEGILTSENLDDIKNRTLTAIMPSTYNLTANLADGNYWSTFYFGSMGFTIDEGVNAYAYTAEVSTDEITLHLLGKVIPKGTAVIIVGGKDTNGSINMNASTESIDEMPKNDLRGVDVATALADLKTAYSADALLMLSNKNGNFGFHDVAIENVPARKAFLPIKDSDGARSLNIVFGDDDTTGITTTNYTNFTNSNDAWFDLQGRRIQMPTQRGLYIHNGKKIVVK